MCNCDKIITLGVGRRTVIKKKGKRETKEGDNEKEEIKREKG